MTPHPAATQRFWAHSRALRRLATLVAALALLTWLSAAKASAEVVPAGGDFQATPPTWTATSLRGTANVVSASQASSGSNRFYRTQYATPANLLGAGLAGMAATEGITSPNFTWSQASPQTLVASYDRGATFSGVLGVDANAGIGMYLQNVTTGTETLLIGERLTQSSADFTTVSSPVSPSLLVNGDTYRVQVRETFDPTVLVAGSATIDLDDVGLTATPATPPAPVLSPNSAQVTDVTSSGATADATIDPGSADTSVRVDYGTTTAYGSTMSGQTLTANSGPSQVSLPITGLSPSTTYHAQITATNAGGNVSSDDLTFTTPGPSPTPPPTTGSGSAQGTVGEHTATVGTTIDDAGAGSTYYVEYGTSTSYGITTSPQTDPAGTVGSTAVTTGLSDLAPNTTYHAQYVVTNPGGTTDGGDFTFTTAPTSPPTVGATSAATTTTDGTQETVSAVVDPGANDTQVSVSYGATASYGTTTSTVLVGAGSGSQTVTIPIAGVTPGDTYQYQVTATNADGTATSGDATFIPTSPDSPPVGQTSISSGPDEYSATLASTIDTGASGGTYELQYGTTTAYASQTAIQSLTATSGNQQLGAALTGLTPGTTYHARFVAMVNGHPDSTGADVQFTTAPASPPTITSDPSAATSDSAGDQEVISTNVDPGSHDTRVTVSYGTSTSYGTTTPATTVSAGSGSTTVAIPLAGLDPGTAYHYQVTAANADGSVSSTDATFIPTSSTSPPLGTTAPTNGPDQHSVTLGSSIDTAGNGGRYFVQYGTDTTYGSRTGDQNLTATSASQPLSASITGLQPGTTYHARFVVDVDGHPASYGADYTFTTTAPPAFVSAPTAATSDNGGDQETVSAAINPGGLQTTVSVAYGPDSSYGSNSSTATVTADAGTQTVQIPISSLTPGNTYHYQVTATNADGAVTTTDNTFTPTAQTTPAVGATSVTAGPGEQSVTLSSSIDTAGHSGSYYLQYGNDTTYGSHTATQNLSAGNSSQSLTASLTGLTPGTTYHAQFVAAVNDHTTYGSDYTFTTAPLSPPTFGTGQANAITASADGTQETVSAAVNPGEHDTTVSVSYGTSSAYGSTATASSVLSAGSGPGNVSVTLTGLTPGATYHYQVNAGNADGTVHTVDATFIPTATTHPPVGATSTAQTPGSGSATLDSTIDSGGNGGTYHLQYGTSTAYGSQTSTQSLTAAAGSQPLTASPSDLAPGTTYHARFVVLVDGYATSYGPDYTFTTAPAATDDAVATVDAQAATVQVTVDPGASDTTVYADYGPTSAYGSQTGTVPVPANSGPTTVTLPLAGLSAGTTYYVQFVIGNASSALRTAALSFTTLGAAGTTTTPPTTTTTGTTTTPPPPVRSSGSACVAAYVAASARTLRMLSVPAGAQLTAGHGLRVALARRVRMSGAPTVALSGGPRTKIRGRAFTITRAQLRSGSTTVVRVVVPQRGRRALTLSLRINAAGCGIQLSSAYAGGALLLRLRLPLGAHRVTFTLPRGMGSPTAIAVTTVTGTRSLALAGHGGTLHLRRQAGTLRVSAHGTSVTVSGVGRTTSGLALRFAASSASGTVTARVSQLSGGPRSVRVLVGAHRRTPVR